MRSRTVVIVIVMVVLVVVGGVYFTQRATANNGEFVLSGTIEVTETNLPTLSGGVVEKVYVDEGNQVHKDEPLVDLYSPSAKTNERVTSPIDGTALQRLVEPDEIAEAGSTVMVVARLTSFILKSTYRKIAMGRSRWGKPIQ